MIDRAGVVRRSSDQRKSSCRVDRVVHAGRAIVAAEHLKMDYVGPFRDERVKRQPGQARSVGDHHAVTFDDQPLDQLLPLRRAQIDGGRTLSLVQAGPVN